MLIDYALLLDYIKVYLLPTQVSSKEFGIRFLTQQRFTILKILALGNTVLISIFTLLSFKYNEKIKTLIVLTINALCDRTEEVKIKNKEASLKEKQFLYLSILIFAIINFIAIITFPLHIDEAFSFVFLVDRGFLTTLTFYPGPNNHVAYLLLSSLVKLVSDNPLICLRLPVFIISIVFFFQLYLFIKSLSNWKSGLLGTWFFFLTPYGFFYSSHGRGYLLMSLCVLLILISGLRWMKNERNTDLLLFILFTSLGLFTIPTFIYPLSSVILLVVVSRIMERRRKQLIMFLISCGIASLLTLLFYSPILILNGVDSITGNSWVQPLDVNAWYQQLLTYIIDWVNFPFGEGVLAAFATPIFILFGIVFLFDKKYNLSKGKKTTLVGIIILIFFPFLMIILQKVLPPVRTWTFHLISLSVITSLIIYKLEEDILISKYKVSTVCILLFGVYSYLNLYLDWSDKKNIYSQLDDTVEFIFDKKAKNVFVGKDIYNVFLRLKYINTDNSIYIETDNKKLSANYEYIILSKGQIPPEGYEIVFFDDYINLFGRILTP